jgi:hypothetical protein
MCLQCVIRLHGDVWASVGPSGVGVSMGEKEEEAEAADMPFYAFRSSFGDIDTGGDAGAGMSIRHDRHSGVFVAICLACSARHSTTPKPWNVVRVLCCPEGTRFIEGGDAGIGVRCRCFELEWWKRQGGGHTSQRVRRCFFFASSACC